MGKYPITVEEYLAFVDSGGYGDACWWDTIVWELRSKELWMTPDRWDDQLRTPNRPVVFVSWFEANAYCVSLSAQWGRNVRLPSEKQWQRTAQGESVRKYPWGQKGPNLELANYNGKLGYPTPVGVYPAGNGPYGHCDLGGNVWEWCRDILREGELPAYIGGESGGHGCSVVAVGSALRAICKPRIVIVIQPGLMAAVGMALPREYWLLSAAVFQLGFARTISAFVLRPPH